jgi:hypothetical protein
MPAATTNVTIDTIALFIVIPPIVERLSRRRGAFARRVRDRDHAATIRRAADGIKRADAAVIADRPACAVRVQRKY